MLVEPVACGVVFFLLDQWSKWWVAVRVNGGASSRTPRIRFVTHRRKVFELRRARAMMVLSWMAALASATILYRFGGWFQNQIALVGLGLAFSGSAGNLLDILRHHYIVDFIELGFWPVFNLADVGIIAGLSSAFYWHT